MLKRERLCSALFLTFCFGLAAGCSGGGGDDTGSNTGGGGGTSPITITGSVTAPGGVLAKPQAAQSTGFFKWFVSLFSVTEGVAQSSGLVAVSGANILVFRVDDSGDPSGAPLVTTTTDGSGNFSLALPPGVGLSSDLIAQASTGTDPQPVCVGGSCSGSALNCPVVSNVLNINPTAELGTRVIFQDIATRAGTLSNYTSSEIVGLIGQLQSLAQASDLVGATIEETIANLRAAFQPLIDITLGALSSAGENTPPSVAGAYNFAEFTRGMDEFGGITGTTGTGTFTLNADGTFSGSESLTDVRQAEACGQSACDRTFTRNIFSNEETFSGVYSVGSNGTILLTEDGDSFVGFFDPTGNVAVIPVGGGGDEESGFVVALRQGEAVPAGLFNTAGIGTQIPDTFSASGSWSRFTSVIESGPLNVTESSFSGNLTLSSVQPQVSCTAAYEVPCSLSASVSTQEDLDTVSGSVSVSSTGTVVLTDDDLVDGGPVAGAIGPDGHVMWVQTEDGSEGAVGLLLATQQGSDMSNASLNGAYNIVAFENHFDNDSTLSGALSVGVLTLDGVGGWKVAGVSTDRQLRESCSQEVCPSLTQETGTEGFDIGGTYDVNPDGTFTFSANAPPDVFSFDGTVSPDGNVLTLRDLDDSAEDASVFFLVGVKQ